VTHLLECGGHDCQHTRLTIGHIQYEGSDGYALCYGGEGCQDGPALQHVASTMDTAHQVIPRPHTIEAGVIRGYGCVPQVAPVGVEWIQQDVRVENAHLLAAAAW
jgi:hypothetical protein